MILRNWKRIFISIKYFLKLIFFGDKYDVVFVCSSTFNRGKNGENYLFKPMIEFCKKNNISYIIFEDTFLRSYKNYKMNEKAIPIDLISILQILSRKILRITSKPTSSDEIFFQESKIAKIIKNIFFKKFYSKVYITLIWNNVTLWRAVNPYAAIVDYQHGFIFDGEEEYIDNGSVAKVKTDNDVITLVHGDRYKNILINKDKLGFYNQNNVITVGINNTINKRNKNPVNSKKIIFTLQLTADFDQSINAEYSEIVRKLISKNADFLSSNGYQVIFRHHPRYSEYYCTNIKFDYPFVVFDNHTPLEDLLEIASIHMTFHSTSAFDASFARIPTIFIDMHKSFSPKEMFLKQYAYPLQDLVIRDYKSFKYTLQKLEDNLTYNNSCTIINKWAKEFYSDFDELAFKDFLSNYLDKFKKKDN